MMKIGRSYKARMYKLFLLILFAHLHWVSVAREGVEVGRQSVFTQFISADQVERLAFQQYKQLLQQANNKRALGSDQHPQVQRLRSLVRKIVPFGYEWNQRSQQWQWEVNLIGSDQINAFCMPGGKIAVYTGLLNGLDLTDDELAMVIGHEIAHALREHSRERMAKGAATEGFSRIGGAVVAGVLGINPNLTDMLARGGAGLLTLKFSREDEIEADLVGMEIAARAGYDPRAALILWEKMAATSKKSPPQWLSTHPSSASRAAEIKANLNKVIPLYNRAVHHQ
jgi:predicted Zn-dependent protease